MHKKNHSNKNPKDTKSPTSKNYIKNIKNKSIEDTPYGKDEPSHHTEYK